MMKRRSINLRQILVLFTAEPDAPTLKVSPSGPRSTICLVKIDYFIENAPYGFLFTSRKTLETNEWVSQVSKEFYMEGLLHEIGLICIINTCTVYVVIPFCSSHSSDSVNVVLFIVWKSNVHDCKKKRKCKCVKWTTTNDYSSIESHY